MCSSHLDGIKTTIFATQRIISVLYLRMKIVNGSFIAAFSFHARRRQI